MPRGVAQPVWHRLDMSASRLCSGLSSAEQLSSESYLDCAPVIPHQLSCTKSSALGPQSVKRLLESATACL